ncbi:solute carrier family 12 member 3-like [Aplochiton taeniatus]
MGQLGSKHGQRASISEEPPQYYLPRVNNTGQPDGFSDVNIPPPPSVTFSTDSGYPDRDGRDSTDARRPSIYSTIDALPKADYYANVNSVSVRKPRKRPSLDLLRKPFDVSNSFMSPEDGNGEVGVSGDGSLPDLNDAEIGVAGKDEKPPIRFGWIIGVMIRCMLNIWGVILFLRLSWLTSQAGILLMWLIIFMSITVTTATALSVSAISTNGRVKSGGTYFMISRSLGPEFGGAIGAIFSFANALAAALNTVGYAEVVRDLLEERNSLMVDRINDVRIIGVVTQTILLIIAFCGMEWEEKTQLLFFVALMLSFANYLAGTVMPSPVEKQAIGVFSYRREIFVDNLLPSWRGPDGNFFKAFAIFFPSATGILSGVNICGDLKDPCSAIPKGTLWAIFWTTFSYLVVSVTSASCLIRDASGNIADMLPANYTGGDCVGVACQYGWNFTQCITEHNCKYGLANSFQALSQLSGTGYLIVVGVFAASLSSALAFQVSAPKIFQCLCQDNIYPYIKFFGKGYGKNNEPLRGYALCYVLAVATILIADLNFIAPLISNFFLCAYGLINFSCFHATVTNSPGWRPEFKYFSKWTALYGTCMSVLLMFLLTWWAALFTFFVLCCLLGYVTYSKPKVNWGSSMQASTYKIALAQSVTLSTVEDHVKNSRPQCLVLTGPPNLRPGLVDFVSSFTKTNSLMICGDVIMEKNQVIVSASGTDGFVKWLNKRKVRAFYTPFLAESLRVGARNLMQASGLGKLKPNVLIMGFKNNWTECQPSGVLDYVNTINDTFDSNYSVCLLRMMDGLDVSDELECEINESFEPDDLNESEENTSADKEDAGTKEDTDGVPSGQIRTVFQTSQRKKTIDVYWISDDGGLTLLVPYLMTRRRLWRNSKVRVFIISDQANMEEDRKEMKALLKRFRLDFKDVIAVTDSTKPPQLKNQRRFEDIIAPFRLRDEEQEDVSVQQLRAESPWKISDKEMEALNQKVSMPVPQSDCPSILYMAWLDALTCGLSCPTALIRGNQENVLCFYL